jgi:hypothetical protein
MGAGGKADDSVLWRSLTAGALKGDSGPGENVGVTERADEGRRWGKSAATRVIGEGGTTGVSAVVETNPSMYSAWDFPARFEETKRIDFEGGVLALSAKQSR